MDKKSAVSFRFSKRIKIPQSGVLRHFIAEIFKKENTPLEFIAYEFCSDKKILQVNQQFLNHDYYTDIITFELNERGEPVQANVFISVDTVLSNSQLLGVDFLQELYRVIFHGALHLTGYNDKTEKERRVMRKMEKQYIDEYLSL